MSTHIVDVNMTARRVCILHELGSVADQAHEIEECDRANILNSLARFVGAEGGTRKDLLVLAGYALAAVEAMDEAAAR